MIITVFALCSVGLKLKYEQILLQKDSKTKALKSEDERNTKLIADYQNETEEEKIVAIAETEIGLIRNTEPAVIIKYNNSKIEEINGMLKR
jgi:hypothetical protein